MSLFDFPRIHLQGTMVLNPGTANNDDYAGAVTLPKSYGQYAGQTLALMDSELVKAKTYGMCDKDFIAWAQTAQTSAVGAKRGEPSQIIPAEWNYYGNMKSTIEAINPKIDEPDSSGATVIAVQTGPGKVYTTVDPGVPLTSLIG